MRKVAEVMRKVAEVMRKVAEVMRRIAEVMRNVAEVMRKIAEVMRRIAEVMRKIAEVECKVAEIMYFLKCIFLKCFLSKVYFCKMYPTCVSSKLCEFILFEFIYEIFCIPHYPKLEALSNPRTWSKEYKKLSNHRIKGRKGRCQAGSKGR